MICRTVSVSWMANLRIITRFVKEKVWLFLFRTHRPQARSNRRAILAISCDQIGITSIGQWIEMESCIARSRWITSAGSTTPEIGFTCGEIVCERWWRGTRCVSTRMRSVSLSQCCSAQREQTNQHEHHCEHKRENRVTLEILESFYTTFPYFCFSDHKILLVKNE